MRELTSSTQQTKGQFGALTELIKGVNKEDLRAQGFAYLADSFALISQVGSIFAPLVAETPITLTHMEARLRINELTAAQVAVCQSFPRFTSDWESYRVARGQTAWLSGPHGPSEGQLPPRNVASRSLAANKGFPGKVQSNKKPIGSTHKKSKPGFRSELPPWGQRTWGVKREVTPSNAIEDRGSKPYSQLVETSTKKVDGMPVAISKISAFGFSNVFSQKPDELWECLEKEKARLEQMASPQEGKLILLKAQYARYCALQCVDDEEKSVSGESDQGENSESEDMDSASPVPGNAGISPEVNFESGSQKQPKVSTRSEDDYAVTGFSSPQAFSTTVSPEDEDLVKSLAKKTLFNTVKASLDKKSEEAEKEKRVSKVGDLVIEE